MPGLIFIGLGLAGDRSVTVEGLDCVRRAEKVYLESYTSPLPMGVKERLEEASGRGVVLVERGFVEDGGRIIEEAKRGVVALLVYGDPMVATTHMDLRVRAEAEGVKTRLIHNASILSALPGETGLHIYSFGRTVTMTRGGGVSHTTVYNTVFENLLRGLHTAILLEYDYSTGFSLDPSAAIEGLLEAEADLRYGVIDGETFIIVASRIGCGGQSVVGGRVERLRGVEFGPPPHTVIVPGRLHFTEVEALKMVLKIGGDEVSDNSERIVRLARRMVTRYVEKSRSALDRARGRCSGDERHELLIENAECYISDAERFLNQGRDELAVLSIGYAEGLLDSLRLLDQERFGDIWR